MLEVSLRIIFNCIVTIIHWKVIYWKLIILRPTISSGRDTNINKTVSALIKIYVSLTDVTNESQ